MKIKQFVGLVLSVGVLVLFVAFLATIVLQGKFQLTNVNAVNSAIFGAGYSPVTGFQTLTTSRVSASATTIPVASVTDKAGNIILPSNISSSSTVRMYFNFEAGTTREEPFYCTGISSLTLTGCVRGISFQGSDLTSSSTIAQIHNAGASIIMTNLGVMYGNEFVSVSGDQTIFDIKTFNTFPRVTSTTAIPSNPAELATVYFVNSVGAGGFTANNVSSTLGLQAITSGVPNCPSAAACVGINASTTGALAFFPVTGAAYVNVSSTASLNGGFLKYTFGSLNKIYWDVTSFLAGAWTWAGAQTFNGTTQYTVAASSTNDVVNFGSLVESYATGTAGTAITAGQALRIGGDGNLYQAAANATNTAYEFVGVARNTTTGAGQKLTYARPGAIVSGLSGFTADRAVYLSDSSGALSNTPGTIVARVGRALSATTMLVMSPSYFNRAFGDSSVPMTGAVVQISTTWTPTKVSLTCPFSQGIWMSDTSGTSTQSSIGIIANASPFWTNSYNKACFYVDSGGNTFSISVVTSTTGFKMVPSTVGGSPSIQVKWYAERNDDYDAH